MYPDSPPDLHVIREGMVFNFYRLRGYEPMQREYKTRDYGLLVLPL